MGRLVTLENLSAGMQAWAARPKWDRDFHNGFYRQLHEALRGGLDEGCWVRLAEWLSAWRAIRPLSRREIFERGRARLDELASALDRVCGEHGEAVSLETATWEEIYPLFRIARSIKSAGSPVFGSKLCHFLRFPGTVLLEQDQSNGPKPALKAALPSNRPAPSRP